MKTADHTSPARRLRRLALGRIYSRAIAGVNITACLMLVGCSSASPVEVRAVDTVVHMWIAAERNADGSTWCRLLARKHLAAEESNAHTSEPPLTCAELHSPAPRGLSATERSELARAQHEVTNGFRIERTSVDGERASVQISWLVPTRVNPILSTAGNTRRGDRFITTFQLVRQGGSWKIGRE
jgi:hypothetical protein